MPEHNVTWIGGHWECSCGFLSPNDSGAYGHYLNASTSTGSATSPTDMRMLNESVPSAMRMQSEPVEVGLD